MKRKRDWNESGRGRFLTMSNEKSAPKAFASEVLDSKKAKFQAKFFFKTHFCRSQPRFWTTWRQRSSEIEQIQANFMALFGAKTIKISSVVYRRYQISNFKSLSTTFGVNPRSLIYEKKPIEIFRKSTVFRQNIITLILFLYRQNSPSDFAKSIKFSNKKIRL